MQTCSREERPSDGMHFCYKNLENEKTAIAHSLPIQRLKLGVSRED